MGLIDQTARREVLLQAAALKASAILANSVAAIVGAKRLLSAKLNGESFDQALVQSAAEFARCCESADKDRRLDRFRAERIQSFRGNSEVS